MTGRCLQHALPQQDCAPFPPARRQPEPLADTVTEIALDRGEFHGSGRVIGIDRSDRRLIDRIRDLCGSDGCLELGRLLVWRLILITGHGLESQLFPALQLDQNEVRDLVDDPHDHRSLPVTELEKPIPPSEIDEASAQVLVPEPIKVQGLGHRQGRPSAGQTWARASATESGIVRRLVASTRQR